MKRSLCAAYITDLIYFPLKITPAMLELSVTSMRECESCTKNLNTPAPYAHVGLVTLMSHMTFWRENDKKYSIWTFTGVVS